MINVKRGYGFHPLLAYGDQTREALAGMLRPGNAGANTAEDQIAVTDQALRQIPVEHIETIELLLRAHSAGATHELTEHFREAQIRFSVGYDLTEPVRPAIVDLHENAWVDLTRTGQGGRTGRSQRSPTRLSFKAGRRGRG